eukprot:89300-Chlamydomonas_euryale.AAC.6
MCNFDEYTLAAKALRWPLVMASMFLIETYPSVSTTRSCVPPGMHVTVGMPTSVCPRRCAHVGVPMSVCPRRCAHVGMPTSENTLNQPVDLDHACVLVSSARW